MNSQLTAPRIICVTNESEMPTDLKIVAPCFNIQDKYTFRWDEEQLNIRSRKSSWPEQDRSNSVESRKLDDV